MLADWPRILLGLVGRVLGILELAQARVRITYQQPPVAF
jgi:hypothetical protein